MATSTRHLRSVDGHPGDRSDRTSDPSSGRQPDVGTGAHVAGLIGLATRGALYLLLAVVAVELVTQGTGRDVDTRGVLHQLAHQSGGSIVLTLLALGFAGFALWHAYLALGPDRRRSDHGRVLSDAARAVVYGLLCALAVSFLTSSARSGNSDRTDKTWTARVLHWPAGRVIVVALGIALVAGAGYLVWRALTRREQDEQAVLDAAPKETPMLRALGRVGNVARAAILGLIGAFLVDAAVEYDANRTVGLDGALKRILAQSYGDVLVVLVALGFAAFGAYSIARAWINRGAPVGDP